MCLLVRVRMLVLVLALVLARVRVRESVLVRVRPRFFFCPSCHIITMIGKPSTRIPVLAQLAGGV